MEVAARRDIEVEQRMAAEGRQHMVKEANAGLGMNAAGAIEIEADRDLGLGGGAGQARGPTGRSGGHGGVHAGLIAYPGVGLH